jgi:8-oxo-dGTP pyrophosphatase MutT (NUDIX family)
MKGDNASDRRNGGWTIKATKKVFQNAFFAVFEDDVTKPTGDDGRYATVHFNDGVAVLPIDENGDVYLTRQFRYAIGRYDIEVVAGGIEDETAIEAAKRELKEELGIEAGEWNDVGSIISMTSITKSGSHQFIATKLTFGEQETDGTEEIESLKIRLSDACEMVRSGKLTDSDTCLLVLKAADLIEKRQQIRREMLPTCEQEE